MSIGKLSARFIEVLLVVGILLTLGVPVLRIIYGQQEREWERQVLQRFGVDPQLVWLACGVLAVSFMILRLRRRAKRDS